MLTFPQFILLKRYSYDLHLTRICADTLPSSSYTTSRPPSPTMKQGKKKRLKEMWCLCPSVNTLPARLNFLRKKSSENGLITAATFHLQPRGLTVGLEDSPSLPRLLPSAVSHLRFTACPPKLLQPTGHKGKLEIPDLAQDALKLWE